MKRERAVRFLTISCLFFGSSHLLVSQLFQSCSIHKRTRALRSTVSHTAAVLVVGELRFCSTLMRNCFNGHDDERVDIFAVTHKDCEFDHPWLVEKVVLSSGELEEENAQTDAQVHMKQFYKLAKAWRTMEMEERKRGARYTFVLKWRSDVICQSPVFDSLPKKFDEVERILYANSDMYFWGLRDTIELIIPLASHLRILGDASRSYSVFDVDLRAVTRSDPCVRAELLMLPTHVAKSVRSHPAISSYLSRLCGTQNDFQLCLEAIWHDGDSQLITPTLAEQQLIRSSVYEYLNSSSTAHETSDGFFEMYNRSTFITQFRGYWPYSPERFFATWLFHQSIQVRCFPGHHFITTDHLHPLRKNEI